MTQSRTSNVVYASLFAAVIFVGTQFLRVPLPFGYFNLGDCFIILAAVMMGGPYAVAAAAIGASLADLLSGYAIYAPATLMIKALMVIVIIAITQRGDRSGGTHKPLVLIAGMVAAECVMVSGYFVYDIFLYSLAGAAVSLPGNILQGVASAVIGFVIVTVFEKRKILKNI